MAILGKVAGTMLKDNLVRNGVDLVLDGNLMYYDVNNRRIGINTNFPSNSLTVNGNTLTNTIYANNFFFGNGSPLFSYSNSNVAAYLAAGIDTTIIAINSNMISANSAISTVNANVAAANLNISNNTTNINTINANVAAANLAILSVNANVAGANLAISTINSNVAAANSAIATLQTQVYSNANVAAYLPIYGGNIKANVITAATIGNVGTNLIGVINTNSQPYITSVGILSSLAVTNGSIANSYTTLYGGQITGYMNGPIGANTANTGAFTTVSATGNISGDYITASHGFNGAIGNITPANGTFTNLDITGSLTFGGAGFTLSTATLGNFYFSNNTMTVTNTDGNINLAPLGNGIVNLNTVTAVQLPSGNNITRPLVPQPGMFRYNSTATVLEYYNGFSWSQVGGAATTTVISDQFTGDGSNLTFNLSQNSTTSGTLVSVNGVTQTPYVGYTIYGNVLTFNEAPISTDVIDARSLVTTGATTSLYYGNSIVYFDTPGNGYSVLTSIDGNIKTSIGIANTNIHNTLVVDNNIIWANGNAFTSPPGGFTSSLQFNDSRAFNGSTYLQYDKVTGNLVSNSTTKSTSLTTGAVVIGNGLAVGGNLFTAAIYSDNHYFANGTTITTPAGGTNTMMQFNDSTNFSGATYLQYFKASGNLVSNATTTSTSATTGAIVVGGGVGIGGNINSNGQVILSYAGSAANNGGQIVLNSSSINRIDFPTGVAGLGDPNVTVRSPGTKIVLWPLVDGSGVDYAIGLTSGVLWNSVHDETRLFKWFANTTAVATLTGTGNYTVTNQLIGYHTGSIGANVANTGAFTTITASSTLGVSGTANFAGTVTAATVNATSIGNAATSLTGTIQTASQTNITSVGSLGSTQISSLGVGTAATGTGGEIRATNNITAYYSDDRLKTRLGNIENALDKVDQLTGFYYEANKTAQDLGYTVKREVGVSAQEVQKVLPEIVVPAPIDDKYLTIYYDKLVPLLIEAIKELNAKVEKLEKGQ